MNPREAWDFSMIEYLELSKVEKTQPVTPLYDREERERVMSSGELRRLESGKRN